MKQNTSHFIFVEEGSVQGTVFARQSCARSPGRGPLTIVQIGRDTTSLNEAREGMEVCEENKSVSQLGQRPVV